VKRTKSKTGIIQSSIDVKSWLQRVPDVGEVRPGQCPWCEAASRPPGKGLGILGHGLRERQQWGPVEADGAPAMVNLRVRRFQCCTCDGVITVVPCGVVRKRLYSGAAIAYTLALFGIVRCSARATRRRVSPLAVVGYTAAAGWAALRRWVLAMRKGTLFGCVRAAPLSWTAREIAARAATTLAACAPPTLRGLALEAQAFIGGARMA